MNRWQAMSEIVCSFVENGHARLAVLALLIMAAIPTGMAVITVLSLQSASADRYVNADEKNHQLDEIRANPS